MRKGRAVVLGHFLITLLRIHDATGYTYLHKIIHFTNTNENCILYYVFSISVEYHNYQFQ